MWVCGCVCVCACVCLPVCVLFWEGENCASKAGLHVTGGMAGGYARNVLDVCGKLEKMPEVRIDQALAGWPGDVLGMCRKCARNSGLAAKLDICQNCARNVLEMC